MKILSPTQTKELITLLKSRFQNNIHRHEGLLWTQIEAKLMNQEEKLWSLNEMEATGGEPDVIGYEEKNDEYVFYDCSKESPKGRRSVCYDHEGLEARKKYQPENTAIDMANQMGIEILTEEEYKRLQDLEAFDMKTSSWIQTPAEIRELGGALFCDYHYKHVFVYHNGASSYYGSRGFRGSLKI